MNSELISTFLRRLFLSPPFPFFPRCQNQNYGGHKILPSPLFFAFPLEFSFILSFPLRHHQERRDHGDQRRHRLRPGHDVHRVCPPGGDIAMHDDEVVKNRCVDDILWYRSMRSEE